MNVKRSVLEAKTDKELEAYIQKGKRFVPEANILAFEILKSRGRSFSAEELALYETLMGSEKTASGEIAVHENYRKSANFIYISMALGILNFILNANFSVFTVFTAICTLAIISVMGYLVSKRTDWMKYVLLVFMILGLFGIPFVLFRLFQNLIIGVVNIIQIGLQIWALVLLFKIPSSIRS